MGNKKKYNPVCKEFQEEAKKLGLTGYQLMQRYREEGKIVDSSKVKHKENEEIFKRAGCKNRQEYYNKLAIKKGYKNFNEYRNECDHRNGLCIPIEDDEDFSTNFGIIKGEKLLFKKFLEENIFEEVKWSGKYSHDGSIDFTCKNPRQEFINKYPQFKRDKEYRIQLKMKCLRHRGKSYHWDFTIGYNNIADYFILVAWDNRENLVPLHIWIFHKDDIIRGYKFWRRDCITITNRYEYIVQFNKYEINELDILKNIIDDMKKK